MGEERCVGGRWSLACLRYGTFTPATASLHKANHPPALSACSRLISQCLSSARLTRNSTWPGEGIQGFRLGHEKQHEVGPLPAAAGCSHRLPCKNQAAMPTSGGPHGPLPSYKAQGTRALPSCGTSGPAAHRPLPALRAATLRPSAFPIMHPNCVPLQHSAKANATLRPPSPISAYQHPSNHNVTHLGVRTLAPSLSRASSTRHTLSEGMDTVKTVWGEGNGAHGIRYNASHGG